MTIPHPQSGEVINLRSALDQHDAGPRVLLKTPTLKVLRLVLDRGQEIASHSSPGEITVQCLDGRVSFTCHGASNELKPGTLLYLAAAEPHALLAHEDSVLLVTLLLPRSPGQPD